MAWSRESVLGIRLGLLSAVFAVALSLPNLSDTYRVVTTVSQSAWPNWVVNGIPLVLLLLIGGLAARRGARPGWTGGIAGAVYGFFQGVTLYAIAAGNPHKQALARTVWMAYRLTRPGVPGQERPFVVAPILHPSAAAYLLGLTAQMLLVGLVVGWIGGRLVKGRAHPAV